MSEFNSCAALVNDDTYKEAREKYEELLSTGYCPLSYMLRMQYDLQMALAKKSPKYNKEPSDLKTLGRS